MNYFHVDVFSQRPYSGNSLAAFPDARGLSAAQMLRITQELRHCEAVYLEPTSLPSTVRARVFDLHEELAFAGHPLIGAAAVLHHLAGSRGMRAWRLELPDRTAGVTTEAPDGGHYGLLDQGQPEFLGLPADRDAIAAAFGLGPLDLDPTLPVQVVSTDLRYGGDIGAS
jgi:PhzF family phenazine biosynthesis protein